MAEDGLDIEEELRLLSGNLNRIQITKSEQEVLDMAEWAIKRIRHIVNIRLNQIRADDISLTNSYIVEYMNGTRITIKALSRVEARKKAEPLSYYKIKAIY